MVRIASARRVATQVRLAGFAALLMGLPVVAHASSIDIPSSEVFSLDLLSPTDGVKTRRANGDAGGNINGAETILGNASLQANAAAVTATINYGGAQEVVPGSISFPGGGGDFFTTESTGLVYIPAPGVYHFGGRSDDGHRIQIGKSLVNAGEVAGNTCCGDTSIDATFHAAGFYPYRVSFFETNGGENMEFFTHDGAGNNKILVGDTADGGLRTVANGVFTVRDVQSASTNIDTLAKAESLLAGGIASSGTTNQLTSIINYKDSGSASHFGSDSPFPGGQNRDNYVVEATGKIWITEAGNYTFGINTDDGGKIQVDGTTIVSDDTLHDLQDHFGSLFLTVGFHDLRSLFFEFGGGSGFELFVSKGIKSSFDGEFQLVGDVANGSLAVFSIPTPGALPMGLGLLSVSALRRRRA